MPKTIYELFEEPDFLAGSQAKREQMFSDYKAVEVQPYIDTLADEREKQRISREVDEVFTQSIAAPERKIEGSLLGIDLGFAQDASTAASASVDQLQAMTGEVAAQLTASNPEGLEAWALREEAKGTPEGAANAAEIRTRSAELSDRTDTIQDFIDENVIEGEDTRDDFSEYTRDKKLELQELMDAAPTDGSKARVALDFYLTPGNLDMLGLLTMESAAPTAAAIGATVVGGAVGGPIGAGVAASVAEGAMGAGEASLGAYQKALVELNKQGVPEAEAKKQAREASRTAAVIGGVGSALLGPFGEALPVIRSFGRGPILDNKIADTGVSVVGGVLGEGLQGGLVQVAENIAVDPITPTGTFDGAITAATMEALASAPVVAATQAVALSIPDAVDAADEIMQAPGTRTELEELLDEAQDQDTRIPTIEIDTPTDTGTVDSPSSSAPPAPADSPSQPTPPADTGSITGDTGSAEATPPTPPVPEQPTGANPPDVTPAAPEAPATPTITGNGTDVPAVSATDTGGDGVSSPETTGSDGATGQQSGDITSEVVSTFTTAKGSAYSVFADGTTVRDKSDHSDINAGAHDAEDVGIKDRSAMTVYIPEAAGSISWAGLQGSTSGFRAVITGESKITIVSPNPQTGQLGAVPSQRDVPFITEPTVGYHPVELWKPTEVNGSKAFAGIHQGNLIAELTPQVVVPDDFTPEQEWGEYELDVPFTDLPNDLQAIWKDQVVNFNEDPSFSLQTEADQVMVQFRNRQRTEARATDTQASESPSAAAPITLTRPKPKAPLPQSEPVNTRLALGGGAGYLNATIKSKGAERGHYIIADPKAGVAYVMKNTGVLKAAIPYQDGSATTPLNVLNTAEGQIAYERVGVKQRSEKVSIQADGTTEYAGMTGPAQLSMALKGVSFSGSVYVLRDVAQSAPDVQANIRPPAPFTVLDVISPLPDTAVQFIQNNSSADKTLPLQDVIDAVLEDTTDQWADYKNILRTLRPHVGINRVGHDALLLDNPGVVGYYDAEENLIMLKTDGGMSYHTLTHEIAHAATVTSYLNRNARTQPVWDKIEDAYSLISNLDGFNAYGLTDVLEFVAEIYTNDNFKTSLDAVLGIESNKTMWDYVRDFLTKGLFNLESEYNSENLTDWVEQLFDTNEQLIHQNFTPLNNKGLSYSDRTQGRYSDDLRTTGTRRGTHRRAWLERFRIRNAIMDSSTALHRMYLLETFLPRINNDYDTYKAITLFDTTGNRKDNMAAKFKRQYMFGIEKQHEAIYNAVKGTRLSFSRVFTISADYATLKHIRNATRVARNKLVAEVEELQAALAEVKKAEVVDESAELAVAKPLEAAEFKLRRFDAIQSGAEKPTPADSFAVMGGATVREAQAEMNRQINMITPPNLPREEVQQMLDDLSQLYIKANRAVWQMGIEAGEVTPEQVQIHQDSGLADDYMPLTGESEVTDLAAQRHHAAFGSKGAIRAPLERHRAGRLTPAENAYYALIRNADNMMSRVATRPFRQQLLADIQSGMIPPRKAKWVLLKGNKQYDPQVPKGIHPLYLRTEAGTYQFWLQSEFDKGDNTVMNAITNIHGNEQVGSFARFIGVTTRAVASLFTFYDSLFAPTMFIKEIPEAMLNLSSRNLSWENEDGSKGAIDLKLLNVQIATNAANFELFEDLMRIFANRNIRDQLANNNLRSLSDNLVDDENLLAQSRLGKVFLEAEAGGALQISMDAIMDMYQQQTLTVADQANIKKLTRWAGELNSKETKAIQMPAAALGELRGTFGSGLGALNAVFKQWNQMFDVRVKVAVYDALVQQGMPKDLALFRTVDLANYRKRGASKVVSAARVVIPFWQPAVFGSFNANRTLFSRKGLVGFTGLIILAIGIEAITRMMAGDDDEDPRLPYNRVDAVPPMVKRGNWVVVIPGTGEEQDRYAKIPAPYGVGRVAKVIGQQIVRSMDDDPLRTKDEGLHEIFKTMLDELLPMPIKPEGVDANNILNHLILGFTPELIKGNVATAMNMDDFSKSVDFAIDRNKLGYTQGYFRTPEFWTDVAKWVYDATKGNVDFTPQQARGHFSHFFAGPLAGIIGEATQGDRAAKGMHFTASDELGLYNILSLTKLYGRTVAPEERVAYSLADEFRQMRKKSEFSEFLEAEEVKKRKLGRPRRPSMRDRREPKDPKLTGQWVWDEAALAEQGKLHILAMNEVVDKFETDLRALKSELTAKDKTTRRREHDERIRTRNEPYAWSVSQEAYNEDREFWDTKYLELRQLHRDFIVNFTEAGNQP